MSWEAWAEKRWGLIVGGMSLICFLSLLVSARRTLIGYDVYWHLRMGTDWVENGLSPWIDRYSFTFSGAEVLPVPVLFQATLHWFVSTFGMEPGLELLKVMLYALALGMVLEYLRQVKAPVFVYCIVLPLVVAVMELRAIVRPELFSYSLSVLALMLYRYRGGEVSTKTALPIALLMLFWSNYHSPVIGYVIFFGYFVDAAVHQLRDRASAKTWMTWLGWGLLVVGVGALVPGFEHPIYNLLNFDPDWKRYIAEYQSALKGEDAAATFALAAVALITLGLSIGQRRYGYIVISVTLMYAGTTMARMVTPGGIVIACMFAHVVSTSDWRAWIVNSSAPARVTADLLIAALVLIPLWATVNSARSFMEENREFHTQFPFDVVEYMKQNRLSGNVINEYQSGGYLLHSLYPDSKIYIDGRSHILYSVEHAERAAMALKSPVVLSEEVEKYDVSLAVLQNKPDNYFVIDESGDLGLTFVGAGYSLFTRERPAFPRFGHLLARPACWDDRWIPDLQAEANTARRILKPDSGLWPFLNLVMEYSDAEDRAAYLGKAAQSRVWNGIDLRFAAVRSLSHGSNELALQYLNAIPEKGLKDYLAVVFTLIRLGRLDDAENNLRGVSETYWQYVETVDMVVIQGLLEELQAQRPLTMISDSFLDFVDRTVDDSGLGEKDYALTVDLLCAPKGWEESLQAQVPIAQSDLISRQ